MKALTLTQPWATLVAIGAMRIETRSWSTAYRGPLAIHAAKGFPRWARRFTTLPECYEAVRNNYTMRLNDAAAYPLGQVIATCRLVAVKRTEAVRDALTTRELALGDFGDFRFAWELADVVELPEPVTAKGALKLWEWTLEAQGVGRLAS